MSHLYPSLEDKFRNEGVCPICMQEMELTTKFSCVNNHVLCYRCKPYYFACPKCRSPINVQIAPREVNSFNPTATPPVHLMPRTPYPTQMPITMPMPSAPSEVDFHFHERQNWQPEPPTEHQELLPCSYSHMGCWVKFPEHLREIHESRCLFHNASGEDIGDCRYQEAGCNIQLPISKLVTHESDCSYKGRFEEMENLRSSMGDVSLNRDPNEIVDCKYRNLGCMVRMPYHRKRQHEEKCNHRDDDEYEVYHDPDELVDCRFRDRGCMVRMPFKRKEIHEEKCNHRDEDNDDSCVYYEDPNELVDCKWKMNGCRVRPKLSYREIHEGKCNYKQDECSYRDYGCPANFHSSQRFAHERSCHYAP